MPCDGPHEGHAYYRARFAALAARARSEPTRPQCWRRGGWRGAVSGVLQFGAILVFVAGTVGVATGTGWNATAKHERSTRACGIYIGDAPPTVAGAGADEGEPKCETVK